MFNLDEFIYKYVVKRPSSMFLPDINGHRFELENRIAGHSFLVIGGAGSIGSSFIKAILPFHPSELVIVDINENALTELTRDLRSDSLLSVCVPDVYLSYPMDYSSEMFKKMFRNHRKGARAFDYVANFSAHKHVRSEKDIYSVEALLSNNVINAKSLLDLLSEAPPLSYFCVSTDKAANPVNIMGASKRVMEDLIFSYSDIFPVHTARFANVAFSNGSLPDGFIKRLEKLQPLSAPSDVRRYFVSPEESGQICMMSAVLGENRAIFFPKLDKVTMTTFEAIARDLLSECGYEVLECATDEEAINEASELKRGSKLYPVHFSISDTSGEKEFEEFYTSDESVNMTRYDSLGVITDKPLPDKYKVVELVNKLSFLFSDKNKKVTTKEDVVKELKRYLPNFDHKETGKSLDNKM